METRVLITGATGGLGKAFAVECASRGWDLFLTDLNPSLLEALAYGLRCAYAVKVTTHACDLTDPDSRTVLFKTIHSQPYRFWSLINIAGMDYEGLFHERTREQIRTIIRLNIEGTLEMTQALLDIRDPYSTFRIINVASLAAFYPMPIKATYAASKRFLLDFSMALREEVRGLGVTVTALCPAGLPTNEDCIRAIEAQGWMGQLTTQNIGTVATGTLDAALKGKALYIPGRLNRLIQLLGGLAPTWLVASLIGSRWKAAHRNSRALTIIRANT